MGAPAFRGDGVSDPPPRAGGPGVRLEDRDAAAARTVRVVITVQALRAFAYGFSAVLIGSILAAEGLPDAAAGAVFTVMLAGMGGMSLLVGRFSGRLGRRRTYRVLLAGMGVSGAVFAVTSWLPALLLAAATGTLSTDANDSGPMTSIEQAMLAGVPARVRAALYGRYNAVAYLAGSLGALTAGAPGGIHLLVRGAPVGRVWLLALPVVAAVAVAVAGHLPAEPARPATARGRQLSEGSRRAVRRLAALFAGDAFGGSLVVQSFLVFWFERRFGAVPELMALVFGAAGILQAGSALLAGWVAPRLGLLETMVFTHIPSNLMLAAVPFMPGLGAAIGLLLARFCLSQMDVPARQAFVAAMVRPEEQAAAAAYTNAGRYASRPAGPVVATALMQWASVAAPFVAAGTIKVIYDLAVYATFRAGARGLGRRDAGVPGAVQPSAETRAAAAGGQPPSALPR